MPNYSTTNTDILTTLRYFLEFSYKGTHYHGWQIQPNGITVQEELERALSVILRTPTQVVGAGRTDTGVHAKRMFAHFDTEQTIDTQKVVQRLNSLLPIDIAAHKLSRVKDDAHARFDATRRTYEYHVTFRKNPFLNKMATYLRGTYNFETMNAAAARLFDYTDFTSFSKLHTDVKTNNCKIYHAQWTQHDDVWIFTIAADRFLRNMVRAIVGTLLEVGRGKINTDDFCQIIEAKNRCNAGTSIDAHGLYLIDVEYPKETYLNT